MGSGQIPKFAMNLVILNFFMIINMRLQSHSICKQNESGQ